MNWIGPYLSEAKGHTNETWSIILSFLDRFLYNFFSIPMQSLS